jgi:Phage integrase, N-terminal SAM-like domain
MSISDTPQPPKLLTQVRRAVRSRHYSPRTEESYIAWIRRYVRFHGMRHPAELGGQDINRFLSALAEIGPAQRVESDPGAERGPLPL